MKVFKNEEKEFTPFTLNITIETEEEARALFAIFNLRKNGRLLRGQDGLILEAIGKEYHVRRDVIANGITYEEFYK